MLFCWFYTDLEVRPSVRSEIYRSDRVSDQRPRGQTECPIRDIEVRPSVRSGRVTAHFFRLGVNLSLFYFFALFDLLGHFSRSKVKTPYFSWNDLARLPHKWTYRSGVAIWKCDGLFFPRWSTLVVGTIFRFVLIDLSGQFSRSMIKVPNFYWSAFTQTDLHVRGSVWSASIIVCVFCQYYFCLYSLC